MVQEGKVLTAKERVQEELRELLDKTQKLQAFLYSEKLIEAELQPEMVNLLDTQLRIMQSYASILQNRLAIWDNKPKHYFHHDIFGR